MKVSTQRYFNPAAGHAEPELFVGRTDGKIVAPRGPAKGKYDFDVIFEPHEGEVKNPKLEDECRTENIDLNRTQMGALKMIAHR